jgi:4-hydroxybenzoate polyprenyltransferase
MLSIGISFFVNLSLTLLICCYIVLNIFYSMHLKKLLLLDVYLLASFYTLRIVAGALAIDVAMSNWLLTFSSFTFVSLGFLKRYSDLSYLKEKNQSVAGRAYKFSDTSFLLATGIGTAIAATITLALYVDYSVQRYIYMNGNILWMICPLFFFAISRLWLLACQGEELHDPVDFATHDKQTLVIVCLMIVFVFASI